MTKGFKSASNARGKLEQDKEQPHCPSIGCNRGKEASTQTIHRKKINVCTRSAAVFGQLSSNEHTHALHPRYVPPLYPTLFLLFLAVRFAHSLLEGIPPRRIALYTYVA
jgi:hypothetical protein